MLNELIPDFGPLYNSLMTLVLAYQGERGYIDTSDESLDTIYGIDYSGCYGDGNQAEEVKIYGVRVKHSQVEVFPVDYYTRKEYFNDEDFQKEEKWLSLRYSEIDFVKTLVNIAENIEEYLPENEKKDLQLQGYFPITSVSRDDLETKGYDTTGISDETMRRMATRMAEDYIEQLFWIQLDIFADMYDIPKRPSAVKVYQQVSEMAEKVAEAAGQNLPYCPSMDFSLLPWLLVICFDEDEIDDVLDSQPDWDSVLEDLHFLAKNDNILPKNLEEASLDEIRRYVLKNQNDIFSQILHTCQAHYNEFVEEE